MCCSSGRPGGPSPSVPDCYDVEIEVAVQPQQPASAASAPLLHKLSKQHDFGEVGPPLPRSAAVAYAVEHGDGIARSWQ